MARFYDKRKWRGSGGVRRAVLARDGRRCVVCGRDISGRNQARVDHVQPLRTNPHLALSPANLRSLCATCDNQAREKGGVREERFVIRGCDANGRPLDPTHHWARSPQ